ncbi:virion structural protein [Synechococcus phage P60]|uniref:Internal virion protein n=1 Tax=Synechococcus phage P60 TaxID=2905923 RepID=L0CQF1_9CAUD|nr:virion structural protein [Synechococcus phage P60]AGA17892.1 internal virion protein [Synechococcus phage P60]
MAFQSEYRGSTTGFGFGSFKRKAFNDQKRAAARTEEMVRDAKTKTFSDSLTGKAQMTALKLQQAEAKHRGDMMKSISGIVGQTATGIAKVHELNERAKRQAELDKQRQEAEAWDEGYFDFIMDETATELPPELQAEDEALSDQEIQINAGARASAEVSNEVMTESPNDEGQIVASELNNSTTYQQISTQRISAQELHATLPANIQAAVAELDPSQIPSDPRERNALIRGLIQQQVRMAGNLTKFQKSKLAGVLKQAYGNAAQTLASRRASFLKDEGAAITEQELDALSISGIGGQALWDQARDAVAFSTGNGTRGYSALNTQKAYTAIRQRLVKNGDVEALRQLRNAVVNPNTGKTIGQTYGADLQNAIREAEKNKMGQFDHRMRVQKQELTSITQQYLHGELSREDAIARLSAIGTEAARREINTLTQGQGIQHRPELEFEIESRAAAGNPIPPEVIEEWRREGYISDKVAKQYGPSGESSAATKTAGQVVDADFKKQIKEVLLSNTEQGTTLGSAAAKEIAGQIATRTGALQDLIKKDLAGAIRRGEISATETTAQYAYAEQRLQHYLKQDRFTIQDGETGSRGFKAPLNPPARAGALDNAVQGQDGSWSLSQVGTGDLSSATPAQLNPSRNFLFRAEQLREEMKRYAAGQPLGERVGVIARKLGISEYEVIASQAKKYGLPSPAALMAAEISPSGSAVAPTQAPAAGDMKQGYSMLRGMGIPHKGAAYLAGNIMQESSWQGQRTWGEVQGDGSDRNGGIVSWMDDAEKGHFRLRNIERILGKPINQASTQEQAQAMLKEMKASYPDAYRTFMNPNSSDADLRWASKRYWGYGHEGRRFQYARQLDNNRPTVQRTSNTTGSWGSPIYRIESRGYGSTGPHLDVKPVKPGGVYGDRSARMKPTDLDRYVGVQTASGIKPLSQGTVVTDNDQAHRNRGSFGVDFATPDGRSGMPVVLRNGARVIENVTDNSARGAGSVRTVIELPDGRRYAFVHGTVPNA